MSTKPAFLTVNDHKEDWPTKISCRLINPTKSNIGIISKKILDRINQDLRSTLEVHQWRSSKEVLRWFSGLERKRNLRFLKFDVEQFYPSITRAIMSKAITMAREYTMISDQEERILFHARRNVLSDHEGNIWEKKQCPKFDVSMGSADGAEVSELIGIYMITLLMAKFDKSLFGIYRDDGLMVVPGGGPDVDRARKEIIAIFQSEGLKITTAGNSTQVDFLDIVLDLERNTTMPYTKQNANTKYVSTSSSHPPTVKRSIPEGVSRRLSNISSNKELFLQTVLKKAGHKDNLKYCPMNTVEEQAKPTRNRCRKPIWFNPPWSNNVRTNIGEKFIQHFPRSSPMYHIFNTKNLKVT